jgi:hypothetical protein
MRSCARARAFFVAIAVRRKVKSGRSKPQDRATFTAIVHAEPRIATPLPKGLTVLMAWKPSELKRQT